MTPPDRPLVTQIDAFTDRRFAGNPAAVVVLDGPADPVWMQSVATEVNVSATAFLHRIDDSWGLRWFTPTVEVDLCGHATLASAHHLMIDHGITDPVVTFETRSGRLLATRLDAGWVELDLPADPPAELPAPDGLLAALRLDTEQVVAVARGRFDLLVEVRDAATVRGLAPDFAALRTLPVRGVSVTAAGDGEHDLVSRFFAPGSGIDEDPVTGSAHCLLGPYWSARLGRRDLLAYQASTRGGVVRLRVDDPGIPLRAPSVCAWPGRPCTRSRRV